MIGEGKSMYQKEQSNQIKEPRVYSPEEISHVMENLRPFFDYVRLVDPECCQVVRLPSDPDQSQEACYALWDRNRRCRNCTSKMALQQEKRLAKFEMMNRKIYYVIASPVLVEQPEGGINRWILELVVENSGRFSNRVLEEGALIENIIASEHELYEDSLTKAYNRRYFDERLFCIRDGKDREMVFIASDLKDFKKINDTYGHSTGDYVLKQAVRLMKNTVRSDDSIIRMGGDEFLIVLNNCNPDAAGRIIDNIRRAFKDELVYDREKALYATVNFGISYREHFNGEEAQIRSMYEEADHHMYLDKKRSGL